MSEINNKEAVRAAYEDVRNDETATKWCCLQNDEYGELGLVSTGEDFDEITSKLGDSERVYVFLRVVIGDEIKFAFVTWIGRGLSPLKKAKVSTEKAFVQREWPDFAKEMLICEISYFTEDYIKEVVEKA